MSHSLIPKPSFLLIPSRQPIFLVSQLFLLVFIFWKNKQMHVYFLISPFLHKRQHTMYYLHFLRIIFMMNLLAQHRFLFFYLFNLFILFLAALGLRCCMRAFCGLSLVAASGDYSSLWCAGFSLRWLLLWRVGFSSCGTQAVERKLSSCGARAQLLCSMWDLPRPGLEPMSPALAGRFLTTAPPGKP